MVDSWLLLRRLEPDETPPIASVFIVDHLGDDTAGYCDHRGRVIVGKDSSHYRSRDPYALALLLHHEHFHSRFGSKETAAYQASARFARRQCPHLLGGGEASWQRTVARLTRTTTGGG